MKLSREFKRFIKRAEKYRKSEEFKNKPERKPEARWMPWDIYVMNAKSWNERHPEDPCPVPDDEKEKP